MAEPKSIVNCNFNARITRALLRAGIRTVDELRELDADSIANVRNLGKKSVNEIIEFLKSDESGYTGDNRPIEDCGLSMRLISCLRSAGIDTIDELGRTSMDRLSHIRHINSKDISELRKILEKEGIKPKETSKSSLKDDETTCMVKHYYLDPEIISALRNAGIYTMDELEELTWDQISGIRNMGKKNMDKLKKYLDAHGIRLKAR